MEQKRGKILCVDDEPAILRSLQWLLQKEFDVSTAANGQSALALVRGGDFDVVVSDQRMPGMSGAELLREVKQCAPRAIRILLTGYSDLQAILRSVNEGEVFRFISKPWNIAELPRIVHEATVISRTQLPPAAPPATTVAAQAATGMGERLLVLDDDPAVAAMAADACGTPAQVLHAHNLAEAAQLLDAGNIAVVLADTHLAGVDTTRLLKLLKARRPEIVTAVLAGATDANDIIALINQGQIYRFLPKPVKAGFLKIVISSAQHKHHELMQMPDIAQRHRVEKLSPESAGSLRADMEKALSAADRRGATDEHSGGSGFFDRLTGNLRRLFA